MYGCKLAVAGFAIVYGRLLCRISIRFARLRCLRRVQRWAEWFAAVSAGVYIPFDLYELYETLTWLSLGVLLVNLLIVGVMLRALFSGAPKGVAK